MTVCDSGVGHRKVSVVRINRGLRSADAFPVDDRKCVCASQAILTGVRIKLVNFRKNI